MINKNGLLKIFWWEIQNKLFWFEFFGNLLSFLPGPSGNIIRGRFWSFLFHKCGDNINISSNFKIINPEKLEIGSNIYINSNCYITSGGGVQIGSNVLIGPDVKIWSINHNVDRIDIPIIDQGWTYKKVIIGNDVWIAGNVFILPGVIIPDGVVIGSGSVVLPKKMDPYSIYAGNPLVKIKSRLTNNK